MIDCGLTTVCSGRASRAADAERSEARRKGVCMEQVVGIGGVFFKARDPKALAAWYREHLGVPVEPEHTYGAFTSAAAGEQAVWSVPCGHLLLRFGSGTVHGHLSRPEPRRHVGPTPSFRGAGRRPSRGLRLWPVRLGDRPGGQPIRAMGAAPTRTGVSAPRRTTAETDRGRHPGFPRDRKSVV